MCKDRVTFFMLFALCLNVLAAGSAWAGFGFGGGNLGKSGLDFTKGYDINTVTTVSGSVLSSPRTEENGNVFVDIKTATGVVTLSVGKSSEWEKKELHLRPNDQVSAKGSQAQGKDGKTYLMVQKLDNRSSGGQAVLRNERGGPTWMGVNSGGMTGGPGGGMMRGGGRMMR